jgi:Kef-type K+ transport system membrane component KefB
MLKVAALSAILLALFFRFVGLPVDWAYRVSPDLHQTIELKHVLAFFFLLVATVLFLVLVAKRMERMEWMS